MKSILTTTLIASFAIMLAIGASPLVFASTTVQFATGSVSHLASPAGPLLTKVPVTQKASPKSITVAPGGAATYTISYHNKGTSSYTFTGCVFTVDGSAATCTLSAPITIAAGAKGTYSFKVTTSTSTPSGTYKLTEYLTSSTDQSGSAKFTLVVS